MANGADASQIVAFYDSIFVQNCCGFASLSLLVYEYAITLGREVDFFWRRRLTGASVLFFLNRYLPLVVNAVSFVGLAPLSDKGCSIIVHVSPLLDVLQYMPWAAFSALRVFALSGRHWPLALLVFLLAAVPFAINCYVYQFLKSLNDPVFGCEATRYIALSLSKALTIASRTCLMASDVLVIATTWAATRNTIKLHAPERTIGDTFAGTLLRDGTIYFIVLLILNALHLTFTMLPIVDASLAPVSYMTLFTEPLTAVLVSRFMLDLQAVNRRAMHGGSQRTLTLQIGIGSVNFERVVGSLGSNISVSSAPSSGDGDWATETDDSEGSVRDFEMNPGSGTEESCPASETEPEG